MRDGILEMMPTSMPAHKFVLVVGRDNGDGQNHLKSLIAHLNRHQEWIRAEFRDDLPEAMVTTKYAMVLTMSGIRRGSLTNMRTGSRKLNIPCPNHALTMGEIKDILNQLAETRQAGMKNAELAASKSSNGASNGNHVNGSQVLSPPPEGVPALDQAPKNGAAGTASRISDFLPDETPTAPQEEAVEVLKEENVEEPAADGDPLDMLTNALTSHRTATQEIEDAILVASDRLETIRSERDALQQKLKEREEVILQLNKQIEANKAVVEANAKLKEDKAALQEELTKLQNAYAVFENLMKQVSKK